MSQYFSTLGYVFALKLEEEVATLKGRLDDLRKAKNTTITKREREIVEVGFPKRFEFYFHGYSWPKIMKGL